MGMFDELICEYPLPEYPVRDLDAKTPLFQTKDFACALDLYRLTNDGRLLHQDYRIEDRSDHNATGFARFAGCMTKIPIGESDTVFHGWFSFHTFIDSEWFEYRAKFTDGALVEIKRVKD